MSCRMYEHFVHSLSCSGDSYTFGYKNETINPGDELPPADVVDPDVIASKALMVDNLTAGYIHMTIYVSRNWHFFLWRVYLVLRYASVDINW